MSDGGFGSLGPTMLQVEAARRAANNPPTEPYHAEATNAAISAIASELRVAAHYAKKITVDQAVADMATYSAHMLSKGETKPVDDSLDKMVIPNLPATKEDFLGRHCSAVAAMLSNAKDEAHQHVIKRADTYAKNMYDKTVEEYQVAAAAAQRRRPAASR